MKVEAESSLAWTGTPWPGVLDDVTDSAQMQALHDFVASERTAGPVHPAADDVFKAVELTPFESVKAVLLGQDPYPNPGQATGLSFSVPREAEKLPVSLRNIKVSMALEGMESSSHGDLTGWAEQGVLMLNAALTVRAKDAGSHLPDWQCSNVRRSIPRIAWPSPRLIQPLGVRSRARSGRPTPSPG